MDIKIKFLSPLQLVCILALFNFTGTFMRLPIIPLFAKSAGASTFEVGIIVAVFFIIAAILAIPAGHLSDRLGRKKLLLIGSGISAVTSFLLVFATTPLEIGVLYTIAGFGPPCFTPTIAALAGDIAPEGKMGRTYGWYTLFAAIGTILGPAVGGILAGSFGFGPSFLFSAAVILIAFVLTFAALPEHKAELRAHPEIRQSLLELSRNKRIAACWLATFFITYAYGTFITFFPLYANLEVGLSTEAIGFILALLAFFSAISRVPSGHILDKMRKEPFILTGLVFLSLEVIAYVSTTSLIAFLLLSAVFGLAYGTASTALGALIAEAAGHEKRGAAMGGYSSLFYLGLSLSAVIEGAAIDVYGYWNGFFAAMVVSLLGAAAFYILIYGKPVRTK